MFHKKFNISGIGAYQSIQDFDCLSLIRGLKIDDSGDITVRYTFAISCGSAVDHHQRQVT